ncbi:MAG TPA: cation diffusion facilitator family transporter [Acidimicrobiia bacterium]|jgi:cobalt-zinc-cadmium efflux system protein|nr:cation diffusion facilitator family transporter [Acidimicrobiia bacterium]
MEQAARLRVALGLNLALVVAQVIGGLFTHSIGLVADAGHNLTDVAALGLALLAVHLVERPSNERRSFGYHRSTILAAQANAAALIVVTVIVGLEAIRRLVHPHSIHAGPVIAIAAGATVCNLIAARVLDDHSHDLNLRGAWLHMVADALSSAGVAVAAVVIVATGGHDWLDAAVSLVIAIVIAVRAVQLLGATTSVLLESTPSDVDPAAVSTAIAAMPGVEAVHDLHVWSLSSEYRALSAHIVLDGQPSLADAQQRSDAVKQMLADDFGIAHATLEPEAEVCGPGADEPCAPSFWSGSHAHPT